MTNKGALNVELLALVGFCAVPSRKLGGLSYSILRLKHSTDGRKNQIRAIKNNYPSLEQEYLGLEPTKIGQNKAKIEALASIRARWLPIKNSNKLLKLFYRI